MTSVKIKNKCISLIMLSLLIGCKENKKQKEEKQEVKKPLVFNVDFKDFGKQTIDLNEKKWKNHLQDSVVYFNINFENLKKEPIVVKTSLVSQRIPFLIEYTKSKKVDKFTDGRKTEHYNLNIIHQFNTIYNDSIIFKTIDNADFPVIDQVFRIGYHHIGIDEICQLKANKHYDTIDISNQKIGNCIERKR